MDSKQFWKQLEWKHYQSVQSKQEVEISSLGSELGDAEDRVRVPHRVNHWKERALTKQVRAESGLPVFCKGNWDTKPKPETRPIRKDLGKGRDPWSCSSELILITLNTRLHKHNLDCTHYFQTRDSPCVLWSGQHPVRCWVGLSLSKAISHPVKQGWEVRVCQTQSVATQEKVDPKLTQWVRLDSFMATHNYNPSKYPHMEETYMQWIYKKIQANEDMF